MERYRIIKRIGKGSQGFVYLAEHIQERKQYAIKKVECKDENEANTAFKEAMALQELKHPYICLFKEFFVTWDESDAAMYICIVLEFYSHGDLGSYLRSKRNDKEKVDDNLIMKWIGQIIDVLVFTHSHHVIHRDLKPSNIFLQEDQSIALGDFGVATVMRDVRTRTRSSPGSMNWMAPEVLEQAYDERSDVWSLGCIALELVTTSTHSGADMAGKLCEIKHNDESLKQLLDVASQSHQEELISLIQLMLQRDHKKRPTALNLVDVPFVQKCLKLSGSALMERKNQAQQIADKDPLPSDTDVGGALDYLQEDEENPARVKQAFIALLNLSKNNGSQINLGAKRLIIDSMNTHYGEPELQTLGFKIFSNLVIAAKMNDILYSNELIKLIPTAMKNHSTYTRVLQAAISLLMALSANDKAVERIGDAGVLPLVLKAMRSFPDDVDLNITSCNAIWSLTISEDNARTVTKLGGASDIITALKRHMNSVELTESACAAIFSLAMQDENIVVLNQLEVVDLVLNAMQVHIEEAKVIKNCCLALASLVESEEECAYKLLSNGKTGDEEVRGLERLTSIYQVHRDNVDVVESISTLIMELSEYDEICAEMKHLKIGDDVLKEVHKRYKDNECVMKPCETALLKIDKRTLPLHI